MGGGGGAGSLVHVPLFDGIGVDGGRCGAARRDEGGGVADRVRKAEPAIMPATGGVACFAVVKIYSGVVFDVAREGITGSLGEGAIVPKAGFAVSSSWSMNVFWSSIFVSWAIKLIILRMGGLKLHRQSIPFFLGLVLGEFVVGSVWSIRNVVFQVPSYRILF